MMKESYSQYLSFGAESSLDCRNSSHTLGKPTAISAEEIFPIVQSFLPNGIECINTTDVTYSKLLFLIKKNQ